MSQDIFDTRFEGKDVEITDNRVFLGQEVNITAKDPAMSRILIGMGWEMNAFDSEALDLDVSVFLLGKDDKTRIDEDFIFYNNLQGCDGAVRHNGDSRNGAGDGDDESILIDLKGVPFDVMKIVFTLSLYKGEEKSQNLSQLRNAYIRLVNADTQVELLRYDLDKDLAEKEEIGAVIATLNREGPKWHFTPVAESVEGGLAKIAVRYGLVIMNQ